MQSTGACYARQRPKSGIRKKDTYTNPVRTTDGEVLQVADPFVYEYKGTYYMTGTTAGTAVSITIPRKTS